MSPNTNSPMRYVTYFFFLSLVLAIILLLCSVSLSGCASTTSQQEIVAQQQLEAQRQQEMLRIRARCEEMETELGGMLIWCHHESVSEAARVAACQFVQDYGTTCSSVQ